MNTPIDLIKIITLPKQEKAIQVNLPEFMQDNSNEESFVRFLNELIPTIQEIDTLIQDIRKNPLKMLDSPPSSDPSSSSSESNNESLSSNLENEQMLNNEEDEQIMTEEETKICNQVVKNYIKY